MTFFPNALIQARQLNIPKRLFHFKHSHLSIYTITAWNSLPLEAASAPSISSFVGCVLLLANSCNPCLLQKLLNVETRGPAKLSWSFEPGSLELFPDRRLRLKDLNLTSDTCFVAITSSPSNYGSLRRSDGREVNEASRVLLM